MKSSNYLIKSYSNKIIARNDFFTYNLFLIFFLAFSGYYAGLMIVSNYLSTDISRFFTIPVRLILLAGMFQIFRVSRQKMPDFGFVAFLIFSGMYLLRIFYEIVFGTTKFYLPNTEFLLYFLSFVLLPFYYISRTYFVEIDYRIIIKAILTSCLLLSILTFYYYGDLIGQVSRITQQIKYGENYISPLALSYCGSLGIGVGSAYIMTNKTTLINKISIGLPIISCLIPFFLGASRGSVLALAAPFMFYFIFSKGSKKRVNFAFITAATVIALIYATTYFGTGVFDRIFGIKEDIKYGGSSVERLNIWKSDINQFLNHPIFGNSLESEYAGHYSHNILIETLITTGILGFIPFVIFFITTLSKIIKIVKTTPEYFWLPVIFIQAIIQYMFSGAIWGMSWVAISSGLVLGFNYVKITKTFSNIIKFN
ncbi:O-antigen ligase family protein [Membranihabitans maritimus]|uniref:O-antigen ligase family protein n=1 Tax=Membranihabitans maritimus TaxID=2904244 RepID=UPI001F18477C|nr:O-antigen ligase family protein [Membranihabitans maritimus]